MMEVQTLSPEISNCSKCRLCENRTQVVWSRGECKKSVMIIGEAPGENEDEIGIPFIGDSGKMLEAMLESIGLSSQVDCYITNAVKCRPLNNKTPGKTEVRACFPYLESQVSSVNPILIITLGNIPYSALTGDWEFKITKNHGTLANTKIGEIYYPVMPLYHPAFLLRQNTMEIGGAKWKQWEALKQALKILSEYTC